MAVVALVGLILVGGNSSSGIKLAKGTETDYSIAFDKSTNTYVSTIAKVIVFIFNILLE
jgi:hypothetical protein